MRFQDRELNSNSNEQIPGSKLDADSKVADLAKALAAQEEVWQIYNRDIKGRTTPLLLDERGN